MVRRVRHCRSCPARFVTAVPTLLECSQCCCGGSSSSSSSNQKKQPAAAAVDDRHPLSSLRQRQQRQQPQSSAAAAAAERSTAHDHGGEPVHKKQRASSPAAETASSTITTAATVAAAAARPAAPPPVFDLYGDGEDDEEDDDDDEDDDDQPLLALAAGDFPPPGAMQNRDKASNCNNSEKQDEPEDDEDEDEIIDLLSSCEDGGADDDDSIIDDNDDDEEEEEEGANEPILPDFVAEQEEEDQKQHGLHIPEGSRFQIEQEQLHANASIAEATEASPSANNALQQPQLNSEQNICFICGVSLRDRQRHHRLDHIKRCSKKHGVTARDVRCDDDGDDDDELFAENRQAAATTTTTAQTTTDQRNPSTNPYLRRKNDWHGDAMQDLAAGGKATATNNSSSNSNNKSAAPSVNQLLMAGARRAAKTQQIKLQHKLAAANNNPQSKNRRRYNNGFGGPKRHFSTCPKYKTIAGTDFCVDGFYYADPALTSNYFLSHFHADHYGGITKDWNCGVIYCSVATANLVHRQLGVDRQYLHPLPLRAPIVLQSRGNNGKPVTVTLLDANHCPGAVMFLFEIGSPSRVVLHVGDFRWNYHRLVQRQAPLRPYSRVPWQSIPAAAADAISATTATAQKQQQPQKRIDDLYLDTTYCDPKHALPSQDDCIAAVVDTAVHEVRRAQAARQRLLLLFGAYTIGKESVYLAVAQQLGLKVYVDQRRFRVLSALNDECWAGCGGDDDLYCGNNPQALLTTRPQDSILWVVPLGHITMKKLPSYQNIRRRGFRRDFDRIVGFRPTGWSLTSSKTKSKKTSSTTTANTSSIVGTVTRGNLTVHSVPYSEHSSFPELVECLECLNPKRIIPTVSVSQSQRQIDMLLEAWRAKQAEHFL